MLAVISVTTRNYLHRTRALMRDVSRLLPHASRIVVCADSIQNSFDPAGEQFITVEADTLPIPRFRHLAFALNATGLCCALKPFAIQHAFAGGATNVLYLDNDIQLHRSPDAMLRLLHDHPVVLTPHLLKPLPPFAVPSEQTILGYGTFNAGMLALRRSAATTDFLTWWAGHCATPSDMRPETGYDQIWLNYAAAFVESLGVLRDEGYNVAAWNLPTRPLGLTAPGEFTAGDRPLTTFHFSGFDETQSEHYFSPRVSCNVAPTAELREITMLYRNSLIGCGAEQCRQAGYGFAHFSDGTPISETQRRYFAGHMWNETPAHADPFDPGFESSNASGSRALYRYHDFTARLIRYARRALRTG